MTPRSAPSPPGPGPATDARVARVEAVNEELSRLLGRPPTRLLSAGRPVATDGLILCGVLGAKDVGKSSLINALAGCDVCEPEPEVAEGTFGAVVYAHRECVDDACRRLAGLTLQRVVGHDLEQVRNLVLVDLPDFSSTFRSHLHVVREAVPRLDRVVWLWDPIVAGDRSYSERIGRVVKDARNVCLVLNKIDLMLRDEPEASEVARPPRREAARRLWERWREWFERCTRGVVQEREEDRPRIDPRVFLVSAVCAAPELLVASVVNSWGQAEATRDRHEQEMVHEIGRLAASDLERLRDILLSPVSESEAGLIKASNVAAAVESDCALTRDHFQLERMSSLAAQAPRMIEDELNAAMDARFVEIVARRLSQRGRSDADLAHEVLSARLEGWPVLPAIYWGSRGPVRWVARRVGGDGRDAPGTGRAIVSRGTIADMCRVDGSNLQERLRGLLGRVKVRMADLLSAVREPPRWPEPETAAERVVARLEESSDAADEQVVRTCINPRRRRPGPLRRSLVWFILAWFTLAQPVLHGALLMLSGAPDLTGAGATAGDDGGSHLGTILHGAAIVVGALGPVSLLLGLAVSGLVYVFWLVAMFARAVRDVRAARREGVPGPVDGSVGGTYAVRLVAVLDEEVRRPLAEPIEALAARLRLCEDELSAAGRSR
jgi:hypothetical protein